MSATLLLSVTSPLSPLLFSVPHPFHSRERPAASLQITATWLCSTRCRHTESLVGVNSSGIVLQDVPRISVLTLHLVLLAKFSSRSARTSMGHLYQQRVRNQSRWQPWNLRDDQTAPAERAWRIGRTTQRSLLHRLRRQSHTNSNISPLRYFCDIIVERAFGPSHIHRCQRMGSTSRGTAMPAQCCMMRAV